MSESSTRNRWTGAWKDILSGGNPRWKIVSEESHEKAFGYFHKFVPNNNNDDDDDGAKPPISVLCPLAGDDPFVHLLYRKGYSVTAIDLVAEAIEAMKVQFGGDESSWTKVVDEQQSSAGDGSGVEIVWKHSSGRATLIVGDALKKRPNLNNSFDAVYDKDSFGALPKQMRKPFCQRISEYTKDNGTLYLECKLKDGDDGSGPPFSLKRDDLMEDDNYGGSKFEYVEGLGPVYELSNGMNAMMQQTGHVLRRCRTAAP